MERMDPPAAAPLWQPSITVGFAAALAIWVVGFLARLPGIQGSAMVVADLFGVIQITAGAIAGGLVGRGRALRVGALSGLTTGLVNLLLVGALTSDAQHRNTLGGEWPLFLGLCLLGFPLLGTIGAGAGAAMRRGHPRDRADPINWHGWFAIVAAAATLALIVLGGLVTSLNAGLAVPDWPNSFGFNMFLFPLSQMQGGKFFEHAHRLFGTFVGLTALAMALFTWRADSRRRALALSLAIFVIVASQGLLGGQRVTLSSTMLAFLHGVTAQLIFAMFCVFACVASARWKRLDSGREAPVPAAPRTIAMVFFFLMIVQLLLGAAARHFDHSKGYLHIVSTHALNALVVAGLAVAAGARAKRSGDPTLRRLGGAAIHTVGLQILLGGATLWVVWGGRNKPEPATAEVVLATAHQTVGVLLLGVSAMLFAWSKRLSRPGA